MQSRKKISFKKILLSPWTVFAAIAIGTMIGVYKKEWVVFLGPVGKIYLALLQMCILPILVAAIVSSLAGILKSGEASNKLKSIVLVYGAGLIFAAFVGISVGISGNINENIGDNTKQTLGQLLTHQDSSSQSSSTSPTKDDSNLFRFVEEMVPSNIFTALASGNNLGVLFFSILLGISLGVGKTQHELEALKITNAIYETLLRMINGIIYGLPFGLIGIFSKEVSVVGLEIFSALAKFILVSIFICIAIVIVYTSIMAYILKMSPFKVISKLKEPILVGLGTQSSFATIPSAIQALEEKFSLDSDTTNLMMPLGICLNPQGSVLLFSIATIFIAGIYNVSLGFDNLMVIFFGSILAGVAATGAPGVGALAMISIILTPLGLPLETAIIILVAVAPIVDPFFTVANVIGNCTATTIVSKSKKLDAASATEA